MPDRNTLASGESDDVLPLSHLVVLDASSSIAGRYCGRLMAKLGAHVHFLPASDADTSIGHGGRAGTEFGAWLDDGKLPVTGHEHWSLIIVDGDAEPDPGGALTLSVDWFGTEGPYAGWRGNDPIIQALVGLVHAFGPQAGPPLIARGHAPQLVAGTAAFIAALAGLVARQRGAGCDRASVSIFEAACCFSEPNAVSYDYFGETARRLGINRYIPTYPCSVYPVRDGWVGITALTPAQWHALCGLIGRDDLADDPRFATTLERLALADTIDGIIAPAVREWQAVALVEEGQRRRIPMAVVPELADLAGIPHWRDRGSFETSGPGGRFTPGVPFRLDWDGVRRGLPALSPTSLPLEGLRVVDFTMGWAGPLATRHLADLGADVVKIESPDHPDWWRGWEKPAPGRTIEEAPVFSVVNRGKRGASIDLRTSHGQAIVEALIARADIVIENFAPGVLARLGFGAERLRQLRPGIILVAMGAFGQTGPWSSFRAYGSTVEQASGIPTINGIEGSPPALQHIAYGDPVAGLYAVVAVLAALAGRERLGGCRIDLSQVETLFQLAADAIIARQDRDTPLSRTGSLRESIAPCCCVPAAGEDSWLAIACDTVDSWHALCRLLGRDDWCKVGALDDPAERNARAAEIEAVIGAWSSTRSAMSAAAECQRAGIPAAPVQPVQAVVHDEHLAASGFWRQFERSELGRYTAGTPPYRLDDERPCAMRPAPTFAEHHDEIAAELAAEAAR